MARAKDIGDQFPSDAYDHNTQDVAEGRSQVDYGTRPIVSEGFDPTDLAETTSTEFVTKEYRIVSELGDTIIASEITVDEDGNEFASEVLAFIAKPEDLRETFYDTNGTVNSQGEIIAHVTAGERTVQVGSATRTQLTLPAYTTNEHIFATESEHTGVAGVTLIDVNADARKWVDQEPETRYFQITNINKDTYTCQEWDTVTQAQKLDSDAVLLEAVEVAKPTTLRGTRWDNRTIDSVAYTVTGGATENDSFNIRDADGTEETITPKWLTSETIILAKFVPNGTGASYAGVETLWQDVNTGAHVFQAPATVTTKIIKYEKVGTQTDQGSVRLEWGTTPTVAWDYGSLTSAITYDNVNDRFTLGSAFYGKLVRIRVQVGATHSVSVPNFSIYLQGTGVPGHPSVTGRHARFHRPGVGDVANLGVGSVDAHNHNGNNDGSGAIHYGQVVGEFEISSGVDAFEVQMFLQDEVGGNDTTVLDSGSTWITFEIIA
jgi:hypothetical protein